MKLTDLQKEVSPVWEEKGYEVLKLSLIHI